jgi:Mg-chelatase subunit ChlD
MNLIYIFLYVGLLTSVAFSQSEQPIEDQMHLLNVEKSISPNLITIDDNGESSEDILVKLTLMPPKVNRVDADVVLAIDCSSSMFAVDRDFLRKNASKAFIGKLDPAKDKVGIVLWNDNAFEISQLSNNFGSANDTLDRIPNPDVGGTDYNLAIRYSLDLLNSSPRANDRRVSHSIILLTDANPEGSSQGIALDHDMVNSAISAGYRIYTVGLYTYPLGEPALKELAATTSSIYVKANDSKALLPIYQDLSKIIPYEILATNTTITDILPPYLEEPREIDYSPKNYIYLHRGSEILSQSTNTFDKTKTVRWIWGIVPANGMPLTLTFKTNFVPPLPVDMVAGRERTDYNSQLTYIDSQGIPKSTQIGAGAIYLRERPLTSNITAIGAGAGISIFSFSIGISVLDLLRKRKKKQD